MSFVLGYTPFIDAINLDRAWYILLVPICFFIAVGYKAVRTFDMKAYWKQVFQFTAMMVFGIAALGVGFFVLISVLLPMFAPMRE